MSKKTFLIICLITGLQFSSFSQDLNLGLKLHYDFKNKSGIVEDLTGNGYNGTLYNGAQLSNNGILNTLNLGTANGYLDMGTNTGNLIAGLNDFTISTYLYIDPSSTITGNGNFAWAFSTKSACTQTSGKYIAYRVNIQRYAETVTGWGSESAFSIGTAADKGSWHHITYTQNGNNGIIYIDGINKSSGTVALKPSDIGTATTYNWLGRPQFSGDSYLKGASYADFRIYDRAITSSEVLLLSGQLSSLNYSYDSIAVENAYSNLNLDGLDQVRNNLTLPTSLSNTIKVEWASSNTNVLKNTGEVNRPANNQNNANLTLTATLSKGNVSKTKIFNLTVLAELPEAGAVQYDFDHLNLNTDKNYYLGHIKLPMQFSEGSSVKWSSSDSNYLSASGDILKLAVKGSGIKTVELSAKLTKGAVSMTKKFNIKINEDQGYAGYLFVYFTGNSATDEHIFYALSSDGYAYKTLNGGSPIIKSDTISLMTGVRDPHILRGPDGKYYMVVTDMKSSLGWSSNHGIVLMKSDDLINWSHHTVDIKAKFPEFSNINRAWAPQTIYDEKTGKFMIYLSLKTSVSGSHDIIYYAYANADFTDLEAAPKVLFDNGYSTIDGDIIYRDGVYNLFFKTEDAVDKGYKKAVSTQLTGGYELVDKYLDQTTDAVEGACVFKLINSEEYILMYDCYTTGRYEFTRGSNLENFRLVSTGVSMDFTPRHGTVLAITSEEAERLAKKWGNASLVCFGTARSTQVKPINMEIDETSQTVFLPVKQGTDLSAFDPLLSAKIAGVAVSPEGVQDFTKGPVSYTLSLNGTSKTYKVSAAVHNNSILNGYYADPEILYSEKNKKFYLYPTSDGFSGWGGFYFKVFSSTDLVNWSDEGEFINMHDASQISWATGNAWAPCIIEKKINGEYKYVFYFSGGLNGGSKMLGYAVADDPAGPFKVSSEPFISSSPAGKGQQIDSDVFTDPVSGKTYFYWGNGYMAVAELGEDLVSLVSTPKVITPSSNYTEGTYVFYRNGKYYFTWSYGNTSNEDYRVYYGMSDSPTGPISIPANNNILVKDLTKGIYGPGHNSIIQIPGKEEWYMVYHRISRPYGITNTSPGPGNVRELCIDKLEFNSDGTIKPVVPTLEGIQPIKLEVIPDTTTRTKKVNFNSPVTRTEIYSLTGIQIKLKDFVKNGIYILKKTHLDGTISTEKRIY